MDGSKQYKAEKNAMIIIDFKSNKNPGDKIEFTQVLLISDKNNVEIGTPVIESAKVKAEVIEHFKDKKIRIFKYKRRKGYHKTRGHRQKYTYVKILDIIRQEPGQISESEITSEN